MKKALLWLSLLFILCSCQRTFSSEDWVNNREERNDMYNSLLRDHKFKGMTEEEVTNLLGKPEQKVEEPTLQYVYYLGRAGLGVKDTLLVLEFNSSGTVESHRIRYS